MIKQLVCNRPKLSGTRVFVSYMYTGFYLGSNFLGGERTHLFIRMYVCIYTHAWRKHDVVYSMILKTTLIHAACISGFLSE